MLTPAIVVMNDLVMSGMWFDTLAEADAWVDNYDGPDGTWGSYGYSAAQCSCGTIYGIFI